MRIKTLACLALAVCIFAAPVSAKDKNKTADMFLNGWGNVTVPDSLYIQSGTQQLLIAQETGNDMTSYIAQALPGVTPHTYQLVKAYKGEFQYAYMNDALFPVVFRCKNTYRHRFRNADSYE